MENTVKGWGGFGEPWRGWGGFFYPENYKREDQLQQDCYLWFHNEFHAERRMLFHVDNNSWNAVIGAKKKSLGVIPGPSDFVFITHGGAVVFIEMKLPKQPQSEEQLDFMRKVQKRGHLYFIVEYREQFKKLVTKLILRNYE